MYKNLDIFFGEELKELTKMNLPDPEILDFYNRMSVRQIYWNEEIYDNLINISMNIIDWNKEDKGKPIEERTPITIFINSDGGDLVATLNLIDIIRLSKTPIYTIGLGKTYSSGGLLLISGHKRFIFENTTFLLHDGSMGAGGDTGKVIDRLEFTQKQEKKVKEYVLKQTKIDSKLYDKNYRKDWFLLAEEVIKYGIADKIVTDLDEII